MSRISRVNVDVTATTGNLEAGMKRAERSVDGFAQRVEGMKGGLEKLRGVLSLGAGGFGVVGAVSSALSVVDRTVNSLASASERAVAALESLRKDGTPLASSGLSPTTAASLAAFAPAAKDLQQRGSASALSDTFLGEASRGAGSQSALASAVSVARGAVAGYGSAANQLLSSRSSQLFASGPDNSLGSPAVALERMSTDIGLAIGEAIAPDAQARDISNVRAILEAVGDSQFRQLFGGLGRGAR